MSIQSAPRTRTDQHLVVTGATGHLGRLVVESLLDRGVPAERVTATGRAVERLEDLAARGVRVVRAAYDDPAALRTALRGADVLVLVSGSDIGQRERQHRTVLDAAAAEGVGRVVYTSIPHADTTPMLLAQEHRATEEAITGSGLPATLLRNSWYVENYTAQLPTYLEHGMVGAAGNGRVSVAPRRDYAEAAAAAATQDGHVGAVYELGGPGVTLTELAAALSEATGARIGYTNVDEASLRGILEGAGLGPAAAVFADVDARIAAGDLEVTTDDLSRLLGREPTSLKQALADLL